MRRVSILLLALALTNLATAAPVPKTSPADAVLARVTVEHVGSALAQPGLRKELALTAEQEKKLAALTAEYEKVLKKVAGPEVVNGPTDPSAEIERYKDLAVEVFQFDQVAVKLLTDAQHRRLRQVQLQKGGPAGLFNRHVLRALAPTVEQEEAMARELAKYTRVAMVNEEMIAMLSLSSVEASTEVPDAVAQAGFNGPQADKKVIQDFIRKEIDAQDKVRAAMLKCLTAEQRATWAALTGAALKGEELLRVGSMFGDAKVVQVVMRTQVHESPLAQPPAQAVPPAQLIPPPAPGAPIIPPPQLPPPVPPPSK